VAYDVGDTARLRFEVLDADGELVAPGGGTPTLTITLPDGTTTAPAVSTPSPGEYTATYVTAVTGRHTYRWVATGTNASADFDILDVRPAERPWLISLADAREVLGLDDREQDRAVRDWLGATTAVIEYHTGKAWVPHTRVDTVDGGRPAIALPVTPVRSITSMVPLLDDGTPTYEPAQLRVDTHGILRRADGSTFHRGQYNVTHLVGDNAFVPEGVVGAARIILEHLWDTQRGGGLPSRQDDEFQFDPRAGYALPNRAKELLGEALPGIA
jgi:hypothetical protein